MSETEPAATLTCPVCRRAQPLEQATCERCGADLRLLADTLTAARQEEAAIHAALRRGDAAAALSAVEALATLIGPTDDLAALRRVVRAGLAPLAATETRLWRDPLAAPPIDEELLAAVLEPPPAPCTLPPPPPPAEAPAPPVWRAWLALAAALLLALLGGLAVGFALRR